MGFAEEVRQRLDAADAAVDDRPPRDAARWAETVNGVLYGMAQAIEQIADAAGGDLHVVTFDPPESPDP